MLANWCMVVLCTQNVRLDCTSFSWHQPCNNGKGKYTSLVEIQKALYIKRLQSLIRNL